MSLFTVGNGSTCRFLSFLYSFGFEHDKLISEVDGRASADLALRYLVIPTAPLLLGILGLVMFTNRITAYLFIGCFGVGVYLALRRWDKHHSTEKWDNRLTDEQMALAVDDFVSIVKERDELEGI